MTSASLRASLEKYLEGTISKEEFLEIWKTLQDPRHNNQWFSVIDSTLSDEELHQLSDPDSAKQALLEIKAKLRIEQNSPTFHTGLRAWKAVAAILVIIGASLAGVIYLTGKKKETAIVQTVNADRPGKSKTQRVLLTLADGTTLDPDSLQNGSIVNLGMARLVKLANGQLKYDPLIAHKSEHAAIGYNTMSTPAGKQYQLILPDGSKVWLNAQTTIVYPVVFNSNKRMVKVSGEAYFEISADKSKPFEVQAGNIQVEVLGTHFNVNAYPNEENTKTSLLEGSVKINNHILKPGQAYVNGKLFKTDVYQDVSWKEGVFNFNNQHFAQVMRILARWYDLDIEYPNGIPTREYAGEMGINLDLTQMLKGLEDSGLHFKLEGRRLIVQP